MPGYTSEQRSGTGLKGGRSNFKARTMEMGKELVFVLPHSSLISARRRFTCISIPCRSVTVCKSSWFQGSLPHTACLDHILSLWEQEKNRMQHACLSASISFRKAALSQKILIFSKCQFLLSGQQNSGLRKLPALRQTI